MILASANSGGSLRNTNGRELMKVVLMHVKAFGRFCSALFKVDHAAHGVEPLNGVSKGGEASPLVASGVQTPFAILY